MKLLIAEDCRTTLGALTELATLWGYEVAGVSDGAAAWRVLQEADAPPIALLDWTMPLVDGLEVCHLVRQQYRENPPYLILITGKGREADLVAGLSAGANDYVIKPASPAELRARLGAGQRVVELQTKVADRMRKLEQALSRVRQLQGLLPICGYCKKVRDDQNYWRQVEDYISANSEARFSHGICPDCYVAIVEPELRELGATELHEVAATAAPSRMAAQGAEHEMVLRNYQLPRSRQAECRTAPRYECEWNVPIQLRGEGEMDTATVKDLSAKGIRLELPCGVKPAATLGVGLYDASSKCWRLQDARVVHAAPTGRGRWVAGAAFPQQLDANKLRDLITGNRPLGTVTTKASRG